MNRIIIHGGPVDPMLHVYVYVEGEKIDSLGCQMDALEEIVFTLAQKHNINTVDLAGSRMYMTGIEKMLRESATVANYSVDIIEFRYV